MNEEYDGLEVEQDGPLLVVTLNSPGGLNAMSHDLLRALDRLLDRLFDDTTCRVVVLTGRGQAFCAGIDLNEDGERPWRPDVGEVQSTYALMAHCGRLVWKLRRIPQPLIAAVNGPAVGVGFSLALACDLRILEPTATFNAHFVGLGASRGDLGCSYFLPRIVGPESAADILFTGRSVGAEEAIRMRLASRLTPAGESVAEAAELARQICANAPFGTRMTKSLLNLSMDGATLEQMIELENRTQILATRTADFTEGVTAFAAKRGAVYADR